MAMTELRTGSCKLNYARAGKCGRCVLDGCAMGLLYGMRPVEKDEARVEVGSKNTRGKQDLRAGRRYCLNEREKRGDSPASKRVCNSLAQAL